MFSKFTKKSKTNTNNVVTYPGPTIGLVGGETVAPAGAFGISPRYPTVGLSPRYPTIGSSATKREMLWFTNVNK